MITNSNCYYFQVDDANKTHDEPESSKTSSVTTQTSIGNVDDNIAIEMEETHGYIEYSPHVVEQDSHNQFIILENVSELPSSVEVHDNIFENSLELYNMLQENETEGLEVTPIVDTEQEIEMQVSLIDTFDDTEQDIEMQVSLIDNVDYTGNNEFVV